MGNDMGMVKVVGASRESSFIGDGYDGRLCWLWRVVVMVIVVVVGSGCSGCSGCSGGVMV